MCTMLVRQEKIAGSRKGTKGWVVLREVNVSYEHPFALPLEHAVNIDFVNAAEGPGALVAVELTPESARKLAHTILEMLERAEGGGYLSPALST
jgi:hypothetical protein